MKIKTNPTGNLELKAIFVRRGVTVPQVAKALGISTPGLYLKLRGTNEFLYSEIKELKYYLDMTPAEFEAAFPF